MEKHQSSHIINLSMIALLFLITPFLWPSMRPPYLFLLLNLVIVALGAEAGLLSFLQPTDSSANPIEVIARSIAAVVSLEKEDGLIINNDLPKAMGDRIQRVEKCLVEKIVSAVHVCSLEKSPTIPSISDANVCRLEKSPSTPSIFFIGEGENEEDEIIDEIEEESEGAECLSGLELHNRAETFIGNFYKQQKIQRDNSF